MTCFSYFSVISVICLFAAKSAKARAKVEERKII